MIKIQKMNITNEQNDILAKDVSLQFEKGNVYLLLGENGIGKSTLLKEIFKTSLMQIENIKSTESDWYLATNNPPKTFSSWPVFRFLSVYFHEKYGEDWYKVIQQDIRGFGISDEIFAADIFTLSEGESRLINLFVALFGDFQVIFIDEPETSISPENLHKFLRKVNEIKEDKIIVIATHNQDVMSGIEHEHVLMFEEQAVNDITSQVQKETKIVELFSNHKGVINENFEF